MKSSQEGRKVIERSIVYVGKAGSTWDCAEFASWCVYQVTTRLYGCDNNRGNPVRADTYSGG